MLYVRKDVPAKLLSHDFPSAESFLLRSTSVNRSGLLTVLVTPTRVTLENILISSVDHFLPNTGILPFLVILMHVLIMRLYKHFANFILCIVS